MTCCGNQATSYLPGLATGAASGETVRMEYTGAALGPQSIVGPGSGRIYRVGRLPAVRFHDVDSRDVDELQASGVFQSLQREVLVKDDVAIE